MGTRIVVMKDGFIQQIAAPQDLYEHPANLFVATFIGTPQMNTCDGELSDENGVTYLNFGEGCKVALPPEKGRAPEVLEYAGRKIVFGIRPNDIKADAETIAKYPDRVIDAVVDISELLGADTNLYLSNGEIQLTAVVSTGTVDCNLGDKIKVCIDTNRIHLFDSETEKAIIN